MFRVCGRGQVHAFLLRRFGVVRGAVFEAEAVVSGFKDVAMMGKPIEQRSGHLEPPRVCRRPSGLSYAAMAGSSRMA